MFSKSVKLWRVKIEKCQFLSSNYDLSLLSKRFIDQISNPMYIPSGCESVSL